MERKDVETKYTWDLSKFYSSDEKWFTDFEKLKKMIGFSTRYRANKETTTEDLCEQAAKNLIEG